MGGRDDADGASKTLMSFSSGMVLDVGAQKTVFPFLLGEILRHRAYLLLRRLPHDGQVLPPKKPPVDRFLVRHLTRVMKRG